MKLLAGFASFAMMVGIGFIGQWSQSVIPQADAAVPAGGKPISFQDASGSADVTWTKLTNQIAVWAEPMDDNGVYWADTSGTTSTPGSTTANVTNGTKNPVIYKAYDWSDDMNTYSTKPIMYIQRTATGGPSLGYYNFASMAIGRIGGTMTSASAPLTWYSWGASGSDSNNDLSCSTNYTPIVRITSGEPDIYWACMPVGNDVGGWSDSPRLSNGHATGGEINQYTGDIYVVSSVGGNVDNQSQTSTSPSTEPDWVFTVWDPVTGSFSQSGSVQPGDWYQGMTTVPTERVAVHLNSNGSGYSAVPAPADFAMDADGNVYITVNYGLSNTSAGNTKIVRMEPARDAQGNIVTGSATNPWRYYVVSSLVPDPGYTTTWSVQNSNSIYGNAFMNGELLGGASATVTPTSTRTSWGAAATAGDAGSTYFVKFDPLSDTVRPVWSIANAAPVSTASLLDNASPQQAQVIRGTIYNDANGNGAIDSGEKGIPGQTVALYNSDGVLLGTKLTDSSGTYSFIVSGNSARTYYVRPVQIKAPLADGTTMVNAAQTWGAGSSETSTSADGGTLTNIAAIQCYNSDAITVEAGATCYGAQPAFNADPAVGARGSTSDKATWLNYATITMTSAQSVPTADFGFTTVGSYGDSAAGPTTTAVPAHVVNDPAYTVQLGDKLGSYTGPNAAQSHTDTDDGVMIQTADGTAPLQGAVLAATRPYTLTSPVSTGSSITATPKVEGWVSGAGNTTWNTSPVWTPTVSDGTATGTFQFQQSGAVSGNPVVQFRANASTADITQPTNSSNQYYAGAAGTPMWTTPGEIEDYTFTVADAVYRPAVRTSSGTQVFTVDGQSITGTSGVYTKGTSSAVSATAVKSFTANIPSGWVLTGVTGVNLDGTPTTNQPTYTTTGTPASSATITWQPVLGEDAVIQLDYSKPPSGEKSLLELDKDTTEVGTNITATVTVRDGDNNLLGGQVVTFSNQSNDVSVTPGTCTTNADETSADFGKCSVTVTSTKAATYTNEVSATVGLTPATQETVNGSPKTVTFTATKVVDSNLAVSPAGPLQVGTAAANTYTATAELADEYGNPVSQEVRFSVTNADGSALTAGTALSASSCTTSSTDGKCPVTLTSTKAGTYMIAATIQDPDNPGSWIPVKDGSPAQVIYVPGPVCADHSSVQVTGDNALNDGTATDEITATTMDCYDNPVAAQVTIATTDTNLKLAQPATINTDATSGQGTLTATSTVPGGHDATAKIGSDSVNGSPVTLHFTASAAGHSSELALDSTEQQVGTVVTATVTAKDDTASHNLVGGTKVNFAFDGPTGATFSGTPPVSCTTNNDANDPAYGTCSVTFTDTQPETVSVHARLDSDPTADITNSPASTKFITTIVDPTKSTIVASPTSVLDNNSDTSTVTVTLKDKYGNVISDHPTNTVAIATDLGTVGTTVNVGDGTYTTTVKSDAAGTATLSYTLDGAQQPNTATVEFTTQGIDSTKSSWTVTPTTSATSGAPIANGNSTTRDYYTAVLTAKDESNNPITNLDVSTIHFGASLPTVNVTDVVNTGNGTYTVQYSTTKAGNPDANVKVGDTTITSTAGQDTAATLPIPFQAGPACMPSGPDDQTCLTRAEVAPPNSAVADGVDVDTINVYAFDKDQNPTAATFTLYSMDNAVLASTSVTTAASTGTSSTTATSTTPGDKRVQVSVNNEILKNPANGILTLTYSPGGVCASCSTLAVDKDSQTVGQNVVATVTAKDGSDNLLANVPITVTVDKSASMTVNGTTTQSYQCTTGTDGTCKVNITDTKAEQVNVKATVGNAQEDINGSPKTVTFVPDVVDPTHSSIAADPTDNVAINTGSSTITVTLRDQYDNVVTAGNNNVALTPSLGTATQPVKNADGTYTATLTSPTAGTSVVTYKVNGADGAGSASVAFIGTPPPPQVVDPTASSWTVTPTTTATSGTAPVANGNSTGQDFWTGVLTLRDSNKQPMSNEDVSKIVFTTTGGSDVRISSVTNTGNGTYTVNFTSTKAASPNASVTYNGATIGATADQDTPTELAIPFQAGPVCIPANGITCPGTYVSVDPDNATADGTSTDGIVVHAADKDSNPVSATFVLTPDAQVSLAQTSVTTPAATGQNSTTATSTVAGGHPVTVSINGTALDQSPVTVTFVEPLAKPAVADLSTLVLDRTTQMTEQPVNATVTARDADNELVANANIVVSVNQSATVGPTNQKTFSCKTGEDGTCTVALTDIVPEDVTVRATLNENGTMKDILQSPQTVTFTNEPCIPMECIPNDDVPDSNRTRVEVDPDNQPAGSGTDVATVYVFDKNGYPVNGATIASTTTDSALTIGGNIAKSNAQGESTISYTSAVAGGHEAAVTINGTPVAFLPQGATAIDPSKSSPITLNFTPVDKPISDLYTTWTVTPTTTAESGDAPVANGNSTGNDYWTAVITVKDVDDAAKANLDPSTIHFTPSTSDVVVSPVQNTGNGTYTATFSSTKAGSPTASVTIGTDTTKYGPVANQTIAFQAGPVCIPVNGAVCPGTSVDVNPNGAKDDGVDTDRINVHAADKDGNPVAATFTLTSSDGQVNLAQTSVATPAATGTSSTTATSTVAGDHEVTVAINGTALDSPVIVNFQSQPPSTLSTLSLDRTTQETTKDVTATVTALDADNHPVAGATVVVTVNQSATIGQTRAKTYSCGPTDENGVCTVTLTDTVPEQVTVHATINDNGNAVDILNSPQTVTFTNVPCIPMECIPNDDVPDSNRTRVEVNPNSQPVGTGTDVATVYVFDQAGYPVSGATIASTTTDSALAIGGNIAASNAQGQSTISYTSNVVGDHQAAVTINGTPVAFLPQGATAIDPSKSSPITLTFIDNTAPAAPTVTSPTPGTVTNDPTPTVVGTAEPNTTVTVKDKESGETICTTKADAQGNYTCTPSDDNPLGDGPHTLSVTATDDSGNVSPAKEVPITVDTQAPQPPAIDKANGTEISGRAEPNSIVTVTVPGVADPIETKADDQGNWLIPTPPNAIDGTVSATATDEAGNVSDPATAPLDVTAPAKPTITTANGDEIGGKAEAGSTVTVTVPGVTNPVTTKADDQGNWSIDTPAGAQDGTVTATATDDAGNVSPKAEAPLDVTAPDAPVIDKANGTEISGTAEKGATVTVKVPGVDDPVTTVADPVTGNWTVPTPAGAQDGTVTATATDPAGNVSPEATHPIDVTAPDAPRVDTANKTEVAGGPGATEGGADVTVTFPNGAKASTKANPDGSYSVPTPANMPDGGQVSVTATDPAGNVSQPTLKDLDTVAPDAPVIEKANGTEISGTAEPNATVTVKVPGVDDPITTTADKDGNWKIDTPEGAIDGGTVRATATDPAGNVSPEATKVLDKTAPDAPVIDKANGTEISGTAEPGATVTVQVPGVDTPVTTVADPEGNWSIPTPPGATDGGTVHATATDPAGNVSPEATKVLDKTAPDAPVIDKANGTEISGTAEPGATVTVKVPGVTDPITTVADPEGNWSIPTPPGATDGGTVRATATDPAGNVSPEATKVLDKTAPDAPVIEKANADEIAGTAEPGSTVTLTVPGVPDPVTVVADPEGNWSVPTPEGAVDGILHATATDPAGNTSPETTHKLDVTPPDAPTVNATPTQISGEAEAGSTVTITVPGVADPITTTADPSGHYSIPTPAGAHNGTVSATATDEAGNTSEPGTGLLDHVGPAVPAPIINVANATQVAGNPGSTTAGKTITVTFPDGTVKTTTAADDGSWTVPTPAGTQSGDVTATATDPTTHVVSEPATHYLDADVPDAPKVDVANKNEVSGGPGAAEPGDTVTVTFPDGTVKTTVAEPDGSYRVDTPAGMQDGGKVSVTDTDPAGNVSQPTTHDLDTVAPDKPVIDKANGTEVSGTAEPGSTVTVTVPGVDTPIKVVADPEGNWKIDTPDGAIDGTVRATATDPAGNVSPEATHPMDVTPPDAPTVDKANATEVSGTAEKGSTVTVTFPDGTVKTTTADPDTGAYSVTTPQGMPDGGKVSVTATDPAGNVSQPTLHDLDTVAPDAPDITRADGIEISGTAEPGSTVTIRVPGVDTPIKVVADPQGNWRIDTPAGATDGTVRATATDPAGNVSGEATRLIDVTPPSKPTVNPSNGSEITGTGDPASVITITDEDGNTVMCKNADGTTSPSVTVDKDGKFVCIPVKTLEPGSEITVVAKDGSGLNSDPVTVTIGNVAIAVAKAELHRLETQTVTGTRFNQGEEVCLVVMSDPWDVACQNADDQGTVTFTFQIPADFDLGTHTATVTGTSSQLSASTSFSVIDTVAVKTGGTSVESSNTMLYSLMTAMVAGATAAAVGIRFLKVTK